MKSFQHQRVEDGRLGQAARLFLGFSCLPVASSMHSQLFAFYRERGLETSSITALGSLLQIPASQFTYRASSGIPSDPLWKPRSSCQLKVLGTVLKEEEESSNKELAHWVDTQITQAYCLGIYDSASLPGLLDEQEQQMSQLYFCPTIRGVQMASPGSVFNLSHSVVFP